MEARLVRYCYDTRGVRGRLYFSDDDFVHTLERPWVSGMPGGMPFESCVPDGSYEIVPFERANGDGVLALRNPDLHVYVHADERPKTGGRYGILIHAANFVEQVAGCIAPGLGSTITENRYQVINSRAAMERVMRYAPTRLIIEPTRGTYDGNPDQSTVGSTDHQS